MRRKIAALAFAGCSVVSCALGQTDPQTPAKEIWNAVANPEIDRDRSAQVQNLEIKRDRVTITLADGVIQFVKPANGVVFGAVFHGNGRLQIDPPNPVEEQQLLLFTKQSKLDMAFTEAAFNFTDGFFDEISGQVKWQASGTTSDDLYVRRQQQRARHLRRLFKGVLSSDRRRTALFVADIHTKEKDWVEVIDDAMQHEEITAGHWSTYAGRNHFDVWTEFPVNAGDQRHTYDDPAARQDFGVVKYQIDASMEENTDLNATVMLTLQPHLSGERALLFRLDSNLRVDSVKDGQGRTLVFIQPPPKNEGEYIVVVLADATTDAVQKLQFHYEGRGAVRKAGAGNYYCESSGWYPEIMEQDTPRRAFRSDFELTFRNPRRYQLFATGRKTRDGIEDNKRVTTWVSDAPFTSAGFVFGDFLSRVEHTDGVEIQVYANKQFDDLLNSLAEQNSDPRWDRNRFDPETGRSIPAASGGISSPIASALAQLAPDGLAKTIGMELGNTVQVFQNYFGPYPYHQLTITDASENSQAFPGLLFLGWPTFLNPGQKAAMGLIRYRGLPDYGNVLRAHESAHQWFGQGVSWKGYHDVWLSEGFAEFSANLYVQYREGLKESIDRWRAEKQGLSRVDQNNHAIESLGPISLGWRVASSETDARVFHDLVSAKGAFVLHMLRMQLYDVRNADPDHLFKEMMHDYCKTFDNKPASTDDFKTIVERHMTPPMDLAEAHTMDWFFNQYVYGTGIPQYSLKYTLENTPDGKKHLKGSISRSGVPDSWRDDLVLYGHSGDTATRLGIIGATHPTENIDTTLPAKFDRISINDQEDSLAQVTQ